MEKIQLSELTVNPDQEKTGPKDFELLKVLGKGGYGKVCTSLPFTSWMVLAHRARWHVKLLREGCRTFELLSKVSAQNK